MKRILPIIKIFISVKFDTFWVSKFHKRQTKNWAIPQINQHCKECEFAQCSRKVRASPLDYNNKKN